MGVALMPGFDLAPATTISELEVQRLNDAPSLSVATGGHVHFVPCDSAAAFEDACAKPD